jgi:hypothetical protein
VFVQDDGEKQEIFLQKPVSCGRTYLVIIVCTDIFEVLFRQIGVYETKF